MRNRNDDDDDDENSFNVKRNNICIWSHVHLIFATLVRTVHILARI